MPRPNRITAIALLLTAAWALAPAPAVADDAKLVSPTPFRLYQRDANGRARIPIAYEGENTPTIAYATIAAVGVEADLAQVRYEGGALVNVPTGGPYNVTLFVESGDGTATGTEVGPVFVGDLWVLAGQSNMEGAGDLIDVAPPDDRVVLLGTDGHWKRAEEPLHWLVDSPDPVHSGDPATRAERSEKQHRERVKGAGLGLPFAAALAHSINVPIGLVACAHGGTSMAQWDPAKKGDGGNSLYGSMLRQFQFAGGKVKGVLWYQGESDANPDAAQIYPEAFANFIGAVRADFGQPDLPFYLVQIGRFIRDGDPAPWNAVREAQRLIPDRVPFTAVVSVMDLELDDLIHVGTQGLKRTGRRLALVALHELFGQSYGTTPTLDRVVKGAGNTLVVKFKGVNSDPQAHYPGFGGMGGGNIMASHSADPGGLRPARHIAGFSIRKEDGTPMPLIYEAAVGPARDSVVLKLTAPVPEGASLWYGYGYDPQCDLTDALDMAVPAFGPIAIGDLK